MLDQLEYPLSLLAIQTDERFPFEDILGMAIRCLHKELVQRGSFKICGSLYGLPNLFWNAGDQF